MAFHLAMDSADMVMRDDVADTWPGNVWLPVHVTYRRDVLTDSNAPTQAQSRHNELAESLLG
jgi:hypothetical protein